MKCASVRLEAKIPFYQAQRMVFVLIFLLVCGYFIFRSFAAAPNTSFGDLNNDGAVNILDLSTLLTDYNTTNAAADINSDGLVNIFDLSILLSHYGSSVPVTPFVKRSGSQLTLNGQPFRFSGTNMYWLGMLERSGGTYPSKFDIDDALDTAKEMGATVVRSHSLGISVGCTSYTTPYSQCLEPTLNSFNDAAFNTIDYAIYAASQRGIRLVIPLTDGNTPCFYHGCIRTFVDWVHPGSTDDSLFFTDPTVISDFEAYISHLLNHVNAYNGLALKDDPSIMAWEAGNELDDGTNATTTWLTTISQYLKSVDANHLVIDGGWTMDSGRLTIPTVDIYTRHHYVNGWYYPGGTGTAITDDDNYGCAAVAANKAYFVGEYDWTEQTTTPLHLSTYLPNVQNYQCPGTSTYAVAGDLYWSLFGHEDTNGFMQHNDGYTLHYLGDAAWIRTQAQALRAHAYMISGITLPAAGAISRVPLLRTPTVSSGVQLLWQGVANAAYYQIERSNNAGSTWSVVSPGTSPADGTVGGLTDNDDQSSAWTDASGTGSSVYRIRAFNANNVPGPYSSGYDNSTSAAPSP
jgi:mannan endo-1,4-beta-mannosidase